MFCYWLLYFYCFGLLFADTLTRLSLKGSIEFCERNFVEKIYCTLSKSNRSLPWIEVCLKCTSILITLVKSPETRNYVYKAEYVEALARLMTISVERYVNLFLHLATLLWLLAENPEFATVRKKKTIFYLLNITYVACFNRLMSQLQFQYFVMGQKCWK